MKQREEKWMFTLDWKEVIIQLAIVGIALYSTNLASRWWWAQGIRPGDFEVYYLAGQGNLIIRWLYSNWLAPTFSILNLKPISDSWLYYIGVLTICFMLLTHKVMQFKYGWIVVVLNFYNFSTIIINGNIHIILAYISCFPIGSLITVAYKPFLLPLALLFYFRKTPIVKKLGYWWLIIAGLIFVIHFPSKAVLNYAVSEGKVFTRGENYIYLLSIFYIWMQKRERKRNEHMDSKMRAVSN